jgi:hypothetical protein
MTAAASGRSESLPEGGERGTGSEAGQYRHAAPDRPGTQGSTPATQHDSGAAPHPRSRAEGRTGARERGWKVVPNEHMWATPRIRNVKGTRGQSCGAEVIETRAIIVLAAGSVWAGRVRPGDTGGCDGDCGAGEIGEDEVGAGEIGAGEVGACEVDPLKVCAGEVGTEGAIAGISTPEVRTGEVEDGRSSRRVLVLSQYSLGHGLVADVRALEVCTRSDQVVSIKIRAGDRPMSGKSGAAIRDIPRYYANECRVLEVCTVDIGNVSIVVRPQVGIGQVGVGELGVYEVGPSEIGNTEVRLVVELCTSPNSSRGVMP